MENKLVKNIFEANKLKIFAIICVIFINMALIGMIFTPTSSFYEISIFTQYSILVWIFLFLSITLALIIILNSSKRTWKIFGISIIFYVNCLFLLLPLFRNYFLYGRSDVIEHFAYINEILSTNRIGNNYYPISHLIIVNGHLLSTLNVNILMLVFPVIFFIIYFVGLYLFAKEITSNISETILVLIFGSVLIYSYYAVMFLPTQLSFAILPLFLFLLFRRSKNDVNNRFSYTILLLIFLFLMPFFHPLTSVNIIIIFIMLILISLFFSFRKEKNLTFNYSDLIIPLILLSVTFFTWVSTKTFFNQNLLRIYNWLVNDVGTPTVNNYADSLISSGLGLQNVLLPIFLSFGHEIIYVLVTLIAAPFLIHEMFQKKKFEYNIIFLFLSIVTFTILSGIFFLGSFGISNPLREIVYVLFFCIIINGIFFSRILYNSTGRKKRFIKYILVILILSCSVIGLYSSYASISIGGTNDQVDYTEFVGMEWFFHNKNPYLSSYDADQSTVRFSDVFQGIDYTQTNYGMFMTAPDHFNFVNQSGYLILNSYVVQRYTNYWPNNPIYSKNDLNNLKTNNHLNKIYDNNNSQIWLTNNI